MFYNFLELFEISSSDIALYEICENECIENRMRCLETCLFDEQCKSKCFRDEIVCLGKGFMLTHLIENTMNHRL